MAPRSEPLLANHRKWELILLSSHISIRIQVARGGISMFSSSSTLRANPSSLKKGDR